MKTNSKFVYLVFHREYLVDLLRSGGRFPKEQAFVLPIPNSNEYEIKDFVENKFPSLSEDLSEIWLRFKLPDDISSNWLSLEDIVSAHFYNDHRKDKTPTEVLHTLKVYGIPVLEPLEQALVHVYEEYDSKIREHVAKLIVKTWFKDITISGDFIEQLKIGYKYQQFPTPEKLPAISSKFIWAHLVAYNPGLRKFEERPLVLWLQDIQEVIKRTDDNLKPKLKSIGDKYESKFSNIIDLAEKDRKIGNSPSKWIIENRNNENSYFSELDNYLSQLGNQQSFFFSALLYLNWRESLLNRDYSGKLADHKDVGAFLSIPTDYPMRRAIAEALFTIVYAGGPRVFQQALIEARMKSLGIGEPNQPKLPKNPTLPQQPVQKPVVSRLFENFKKELGRRFDNLFEGINNRKKKKEILKKIEAICGNKTKMEEGEFSYEEYRLLCSLLGLTEESFDDYVIAERGQTDHVTNNESLSNSEQLGSRINQVVENNVIEKGVVINNESFIDGNKDFLPNKSQTETNQDAVFSQTEAASLNKDSEISDTIVGCASKKGQKKSILKEGYSQTKSHKINSGSQKKTREQTYSVEQVGKKQVSNSNFEKNDSKTDGTSNAIAVEKNINEIQLKTNEVDSVIGKVTGGINKNESTDGTSLNKVKDQNQANKEKPNSSSEQVEIPFG